MAAYAALASLSQTTHRTRNEAKYHFSLDEQEKIRSISDYVLHLQSFFDDCPDKTKRWEGRIRDVAHETEDFIEDFMWLRIQPSHQGRALPNLQQQLQNVMEKFGSIAGEVMEERPPYLPPTASSSILAAVTANDTVIGLDDDVTTVRNRLCGCGEPANLQVIPIVGMAGIGKTTLAKTLYNHAHILHHFDIRAWINVSQDYTRTHSLKKIVIGLLESMNLLEELLPRQRINKSDGDVDVKVRVDLYKQLEKVDVSEMARKVFQHLKYRRYLIVMDDVWGEEFWDDVMNIFPDDGCGSRIIVTTRLLGVAAYLYLYSNSPPHEMHVMNDAQCWNLLKQKVFTNADFQDDLEDVGQEIAKSCAGLPLTVVLVAGLLSTINNTRASWVEIAKNVNSIVGKELEGILSLSYMHLPHRLRSCFLYLGGFPEDENIRASRIIKLWEAEGFVKYANECDKTLEEEAMEYLEDLVRRNLVIVNSRKMDGKIKSCSLHDMVRELCIRKAHEEKFLRVMDECVDSQEFIDERRMSLMLSDMDNLWAPTTRTIMSFKYPKDFPNLLDVLGRFKLLRVFHDASVSVKMLSPQVFQLFYLRYLALNGRLEITSTISNLVNLQTLIILPSYPEIKKKPPRLDDKDDFTLPLQMWRMTQLKHLIIYELCIPHLPEGSCLPLVNLQTLSRIRNLVWSEKMVEMIPNVKKLELVYTSYIEYQLHHLKHLYQLEKLQVNGYVDFYWQWQSPAFPRTLKRLSLVGGRFPWADMSIIGSLPNLQVLKLRDRACCGETWETGDDEFPQLKYLLIEGSFLQYWTMQSSSFPLLQRLVLRSCQNLEKIPLEMGEIWTLEVIEVKECMESVVESAYHIKEFKQTEADDDAFQVQFIELQRSRFVPRQKIGPSILFHPQVHEEQGEQPSIEEVSTRYIPFL